MLSHWKNLSVIRKVVQLLSFVFLVYGSVAVGYYAADKLSNALPALACAYDINTADFCVLVPLQHQMDHRIGMAIQMGQWSLAVLTPFFITIGTFFVLFVLLNKAFCGWICPLGTFQEWLTLIGQKLGLQPKETLPEQTVKRIRPVKWLMLGLLIIIFPLMTGLGYLGSELGSAFCSICPSRIMTNLFVGNMDQLRIDTTSPGYMFLSILADLMFGIILVLGLTLRQPFCRICPMLALHAIFKKLGLVRLSKKYTPRCDKCGLCAKACPMDIREIHTSNETDILFPDCTLCGRCVEFCPDQDVMVLKYGMIPIKVASPEYFKARSKAQKAWESSNLFSWWDRRKQKATDQEN